MATVLKDLDIADGSRLFVRSEDRTIAELNKENGRAKLDIESPEYVSPKLEADTEVTVSHKDMVILKGRLYKD